jgi:hypothetical protein
METNYAMIIAAVLLLGFLIFKELKRENKAHLILRILAVAAAISALVLLVFPLKYEVSKNASPARLALLTTGADLGKLSDDAYFTTDSSILEKSGRKNIKYIPDLSYYLQSHPEINVVQVAGYGLSSRELNAVKDYSYHFEPADQPGGIIACNWPQTIRKTARLRVQGIYNNTKDESVRIVLAGTGSRLDSVTIKAKTKGRFSLESTAGHLGKAVYTVLALQGTDTLEKQKLPVIITEAKKIRILVLSSFPDFEYKFLKNWLFDHNYEVVFRTRISKDKFSTDQLNTSINADELNTGTLSRFDGVIADEEELAKLNTPEAGALNAAINQGLGLLIRIVEEKTSSSFARKFTIVLHTDSLVKMTVPHFADETNNLQAIASVPLRVQLQPQQQALLKDKAGRVLMATGLSGGGKIVVSTVASTYTWMLSGQRDDYAKFWSRSINNTIRKQEQGQNWQTEPGLPVKAQQVKLVLQAAAGPRPPVVTVGKEKLLSVQNDVLPYSWRSIFWPEESGWNTLTLPESKRDFLFVYENNDWTSLKNQELLQQNILFAKNSVQKSHNEKLESENYKKEVSHWWFLTIFLISVTYLWFETKLL